MKVLYATIVDANFVARALCLYRSLQPYLSANTSFAVFCVDARSAEALRSLDLRHLWIVPQTEFETMELLAVKSRRARNEYCWTCKPAVLRHAFQRDPTLDWGVYLDSDVMAFGNPNESLAGLDAANVLLTPHRFSTPEMKAEEPLTGHFNAGYVAFRNTPEGNRALQWWLERCLELCPQVPTDGVYADQTYLDRMPPLFEGVIASPHEGLNAAPWNIEGCRIRSCEGRGVFINDDPLLLYHFQSLKMYTPRFFDLYPGTVRVRAEILHYIYRPYIQNLRECCRSLRSRFPGFPLGLAKLPGWPRGLAFDIKRLLQGRSNLHMDLSGRSTAPGAQIPSAIMTEERKGGGRQ